MLYLPIGVIKAFTVISQNFGLHIFFISGLHTFFVWTPQFG